MRLLVFLVLTPTLIPLLSCGGDSPTASVEEVAGSYVLSTLVVQNGAERRELMEQGVTGTIELNPDFSTDGELFIPAAVNQGRFDLTVQLDGAWELDGTQLTFDIADPNDPFVDEVIWQYGDGALSVDAGWVYAVFEGASPEN